MVEENGSASIYVIDNDTHVEGDTLMLWWNSPAQIY